RQRGTVMLDRAIEIAFHVKNVGQVVLSAGHPGIQAHRLLVLLQRAVQIAVVLEGQAEIVVRVGVLRPEIDRDLQLGDGFAVTSFVQVEAPQIVVRREVVGILLDGGLVFVDRVLGVAVVLECHGLVEVPFGGGGYDALLLCRRSLRRRGLRRGRQNRLRLLAQSRRRLRLGGILRDGELQNEKKPYNYSVAKGPRESWSGTHADKESISCEAAITG